MHLRPLAAVMAAGGLLAVGAVVGATLPAPPALRAHTAEAPAGGEDHARDGRAGHAHAAAEPEEGRVAMTDAQVRDQDIAVAEVGGGTLARSLRVPGTIVPDPDRIARVPARVVGTVAELRKRLGDRVEAGEVVAVLDSREVADAKSEYLTAAVRAGLERTNYDRQQALWERRVSAESAFLSAKAVHAEATLRLDLARQKLSALGLDAAEVAQAARRDEAAPGATTLRRDALRAPLSGRVVERRVDVGTAVGKEGDPADLYTVADLSAVWIELAVPVSDLAGIREGAAVTVARSGAPAARGGVVFVSPLLNADTRSARVVVHLPNRDMAWGPGTYVTAEVEVARDEVPVLVPRSALQTVEGRRVVFARSPDGFAAREVALGRSDGDAVEVVSGLAPGEAIAVANAFLLKAELGKSDAGHDH